mmetsp:Transcript_28120/g.60483  ORF Transcript_28120/g.60483 Transcript_28120/m.60483 type:complete len:152 (-) Transcript_28120:617-1072(-)|eukprot:CAMPEP_0168218214 /NCGR_PEP_ID=MMETSP0140_2-20121125/7753_1 /TAXON_ID=44445 /ORGANISM="Pseudo-nitzschia australis, Strain 10249 10 AB" /LENGTH=151 /DNA_ID=CAMNT_0008146205 /DNA_START=20 /DNA_END=475 /DNA_ORIENTATION=+
MNPITKAKPPTNPNNNNCNHASNYYYSGNAQLMEARFLELSSSIRALYRSLGELRRYLLENPTDKDSLVLLQAIVEDKTVLRKRRAELVSVVEGLQQLGLAIDVPDDVRLMVVHDGDDGDGVAVGVGVTVASIQQQQQSNDNDNDGPGFHL